MFTLGCQGARGGISAEVSASPSPLTRQPPLFGRLQSPKMEARLDLVRAMLEKEAIEPVQYVSSPGFYSLLFLVPKVTGGWRPVIDLSTLNRYLDISTFSVETAERIRACLQLGAWVTSLDLKDAYVTDG